MSRTTNQSRIMTKDLYFCKTMEELEKASEFTVPKSTPYQKCLDLMVSVHKSILKSRIEKDEEYEFFFLYRYSILLAYFSKNEKNNSDASYNLKRKQERLHAKENLARYAELEKKLKSRYEALARATKASEDLPSISQKGTCAAELAKKSNSVASILSIASGNGFIECNQLYALITNRTRKELLLIFDVRSAKDFRASHIIGFDDLLNIPEEIISPGLSADNLGKKLPEEGMKLWNKRGIADILVLMDWSSSLGQLHQASKVMVLRNIIKQWDPMTNYKSPPLIAAGGYQEVIERYPFITSDPKVQLPRHPSTNANDLLSNLDYPMEDLEPVRPKIVPPAPRIVTPELPDVRHSAPVIVDRHTKPTMINNANSSGDTMISTLDEIANSFGEETEDSSAAQPVPSEVTENSRFEPVSMADTEPTANNVSSDEDDRSNHPHSKPPSLLPNKPDPAMVENLRKLKPPSVTINQPQPREKEPGTYPNEVGPGDGDHTQNHQNRPKSNPSNDNSIRREPLKKDGSSGGILRRSSSSPNIKEMSDDEPLTHMPSFSRANKPATPKINPFCYNERMDSTFGKTTRGLTGLKNFANNCYMNSIIQCLSNTEPLIKEFIEIDKSPSLNTGSRLKGRIAQEVISAFRSMWSGEIKVYSIRDLKNLMGEIKDIFKGSLHQDSNEFLIILLEHLHEDLNMPAQVENLVGAEEETGEKAWGEFRRRNCSVVQQLFYGQHKSTVSCSICGHESPTFEQFFNLFVPIPANQYSVSLNDCIQLYMSGERISGWKCPDCKTERNATKKFDISRLPPVLIIALKRFTQEDGSWLHKKENLVSYPLDNLDMSRFTVPGSEQRCKVYDLYAMSTHTGTLQSGHYRAICKHPFSKKWFMFDDQSVDQLTESSVLNNPEVYILFYIAKQPS